MIPASSCMHITHNIKSILNDLCILGAALPTHAGYFRQMFLIIFLISLQNNGFLT